MIIDSHCHLSLITNDPEDVVRSARDEYEVTGMLNVCLSLEKAHETIATAERFTSVWASAGVHPCYPEAEQPTVEALVSLAQHPKVVAIGEAGLDFFHNRKDHTAWQYLRFRTQIAAAHESKLPIIIHCRKAGAEVIQVLQEENADRCGGVMHCFAEDQACAKAALDLGFYISFSGILTFKNAGELRAIAKSVPLDRLLVETDAPFLAPTPFRGQKNYPGYVLYVAEALAEIHGLSMPEMKRTLYDNFFACFPAAAP